MCHRLEGGLFFSREVSALSCKFFLSICLTRRHHALTLRWFHSTQLWAGGRRIVIVAICRFGFGPYSWQTKLCCLCLTGITYTCIRFYNCNVAKLYSVLSGIWRALSDPAKRNQTNIANLGFTTIATRRWEGAKTREQTKRSKGRLEQKWNEQQNGRINYAYSFYWSLFGGKNLYHSLEIIIIILIFNNNNNRNDDNKNSVLFRSLFLLSFRPLSCVYVSVTDCFVRSIDK